MAVTLTYKRTLAFALFIILICVVRLNAQVPSRSQAGKGVQLSYIDSTASPCEDFYQYANGTWLKTASIPADRSSWGSGSQLYEKNLSLLHDILNEAARDQNSTAGSIKRKVGTFYRTGMDSAAIETEGIAPLHGEFSKINGLHDVNGLIEEIAHLHRINVSVPFSFYIYPDYKNSTKNIANLYQGGLGLPNRDYYTKTDSESVALKNNYAAHVASMFKLLGDLDAIADDEAQMVLTIETRLANASVTPVEERDPNANYHKMTRTELVSMTGGFAWEQYFKALGISNLDEINVSQPSFFKEVALMLTTVPLNQWKTYLRWQLINNEAARLSSPFVNEDFRFNGTIIRGTKQLQARWKRIYQATNNALGEGIGQLFVEKAFGPKAKLRARAIVLNLKSSLHDRIKRLDWISENTRKQALKKLDAIEIKIGYPDTWRNYSALKIDKKTYVENAIEADEFEFQRNLNKLGKPVDRKEWSLPPTTVDAFYNPNLNEIVFPAGILQPPFFDMDADDATIYGGIGSIIGHELTHGFDDQGRQFDAVGNLKDWWTPEDAKNYSARAALVEEQFSKYIPIDTFHINGNLTLGENIADLGGVKIAYYAFLKSFKGKTHPAPIDGFTAEQRFFLAYAQAWKRLTYPESVKLMLASDPHSPPKFRVNGPLQNLEEFAKAFNCTSGNMVNKTKRAEIW